MAKVNADVEFVTHTKAAMAAIDEYERTFSRLIGKMESRTRRTGKAAKTTGQQFGHIAGQLGRMAAGGLGFLGIMQSVHTMVGLVRKEIDQVAQVAKESTEATLPFNDSMEAIRMQLPQGATADMPEIRKMIIESETPFKTELSRLVLGSISAGLSNDTRMLADTAIQVANARPDLMRSNPEGAKALVEAVVEQQRVWGGSSTEQLGMMHLGSTTSRTTDMGTFAKYIATVGSQGKAAGFTQQEGIALASALGTAINDPDAATTGTNALSMMFQVLEKAKMKGMKETGQAMLDRIWDPNDEKGSQIRRELIGVFETGLSPEEAQELTKYKKGKLRGRMRTRPSLIQFLQADGQAEESGAMKSLFRSALKNLPKDLHEAEQRLNQDLADRSADPFWQASELANAMENFKQQQELSPMGAVRGQILDSIKTIREKTGGSASLKELEMFFTKFQLGSMDSKDSIEKILGTIDSAQAETIVEGIDFGDPKNRELLTFGVSKIAKQQARARFDGHSTEANEFTTSRVSPDAMKMLESLQGLEDVMNKILDSMDSDKPKPVKEVTPKLSEPAKPDAVGVANQ